MIHRTKWAPIWIAAPNLPIRNEIYLTRFFLPPPPQPIDLSWSKAGSRDLPSSVVVSGGLLEFRGIAARDEGQYVCRAVNAAGRSEATADVFVKGESKNIGLLRLFAFLIQLSQT